MTAHRDHFAIPDINWSARSLCAAAGIAICVLMSAMSATASVKRSEAQRLAAMELADEAELAADFAAFLAAETADARAVLSGPRLKPSPETADMVMGEAAIASLVAFDFAKVDAAAADARERTCLAEAIYYEARSESRIGQAAVADVVLNRVASPIYPDTICEVVYQGSERVTGCQFSFTCDGSMKARRNEKKFRDAEMMAGAILAGMRLPVSRNATHYHANYVSPVWADRLTPTAVIGTHKFYRFPSKTLREAAPAAM